MAIVEILPHVRFFPGKTEKDLDAIVCIEGRKKRVTVDMREVQLLGMYLPDLWRHISMELFYKAVQYHCYQLAGFTPRTSLDDLVSDHDKIRITLAVQGAKPKKARY